MLWGVSLTESVQVIYSGTRETSSVKKEIPCCGGVHRNGSDFAILELKANMSRRVLRKTRSWLEKAMPCLLRRWIPCEGWGSSQRADPWQPLLCCSRPPFSSGHAPEDMQSGHITKSSWGTHLVRGEASKVDSVDLEDLVAKPEATQCCWRPFGDKTDKHSCAKKLLI